MNLTPKRSQQEDRFDTKGTFVRPGRKASNNEEPQGMTTGTGSQPITEDARPNKEGLSFEKSKSGNTESSDGQDEEKPVQRQPRLENLNEWVREVTPRVAGLVISPPESQEQIPRNNPLVRKGKAKMRGIEKEWICLGPDGRMEPDSKEGRWDHQNELQNGMEYVHPNGPDPLEGVQLLGVNYYRSRAARNGLLASKQIIHFADDSLLRQHHFFAKDVTLATWNPAGEPSYFHGDATIRIDAPEPGQRIQVPRQERVNRARKYLFKDKKNVPTLTKRSPVVTKRIDETIPRQEILWALMSKLELENLLDDLSIRPMDENEELRTYTIHPMSDGSIKVRR